MPVCCKLESIGLEQKSDFCCILHVDLVYPKNLHHHHNDYPFEPENIMVGKVDKIVPNLRKIRNVIHYTNLYECLALKIKKNLVGIHMRKAKIFHNKPRYLGM